MMIFRRWIESNLRLRFDLPYVHILFGARQTGKTTLLRHMLAPVLSYNLADPEERTRLLSDPGVFKRECLALSQDDPPQVVLVDEAQLVPHVFDAVQILYDSDPKRWRFVLCGSSARKLRQTGANLLPGRSLLHRLYPLMLCERPDACQDEAARLPEIALLPDADFTSSTANAPSLLDRLAYGDLPGVATATPEIREELLRSFATIHLEEEIRREAYVKDWGAFVNFLKLAARESGNEINYAKIAREIGLSQPTVKSHYQLLEDMFIGFHAPAYSKSPRKNLLSRSKFFLFDLGVRHAAAGLRPCAETVEADPGKCFEQWVGQELYRRLGYVGRGRLHHFRTRDGAEIDFILEFDDEVIPIEVKWTERPQSGDARHVSTFLAENPHAHRGYIVCRSPRKAQLRDNVTAIPWWQL